MRIAELKPVWIMRDGRYLAFVFLCPHCVKAKAEKPLLLSCAIVPWREIFPKVGEENEFLDAWLPANGFPGYGRGELVTCRPDFAWKKKGTWETLTVTPSIDASSSGHWHGHIQNGYITGVGDPVPAAPAKKPRTDRIRCVFLEPAEPVMTRQWLRRYGGDCRINGCHDAKVLIGDVAGEVDEEQMKPPADDQRWPTICSCGYEFTDADARQLFTHHLFKRSDTGELTTLHEAPAGAMWFAPWFSDHPSYRGPDGRTLVVRVPPNNHDWIVDGRASNCTMPKDTVHKCWIRHGTPPNITVDKRGKTCAAGAGSIKTPRWLGFLRDGWLTGG